VNDVATASGAMLRLEGLGRRFGDFWAVRDLSLEVAPGEVLGLLGPNGAGKTTTIRLLAALIEPSEGRAWVDGLEVREAPDEIRRRIGILTETPGLYDKLSAERNLDYFGRLYRLPTGVRAERIERWMRLLGIWERRAEPAGTFSKGMRQKLAIARALLHEPRVLFLDEPTAGLDPEAAFIVREAIEALSGEGRTIVLCTHNLDEADRLSDRIAFLRTSLLRLDSPSRLRGALGGGTISIRLGVAASPEVLARIRSLEPVRHVAVEPGGLTVVVEDGERDAPAVVRTIVEAGGAIVEVRHEAATLEQVYFDVMGVQPGANGEGAADPADPVTAERVA
jgi:ABC-2 type transport system ATP-binding protein